MNGTGFRGALLLVVVATTACTSDRGTAEQTPVAADPAAIRQPAPAHLRALTGMSHMPVPADRDAFRASVLRHYPQDLLRDGVSGDVLLDVSLDEHGAVRDVAPASPPRAMPGDVHRAVLIDHGPGTNSTTERELVTSYDPRFTDAAIAAVRETRFLPALRAGQPVPYTVRMTLRFSPP